MMTHCGLMGLFRGKIALKEYPNWKGELVDYIKWLKSVPDDDFMFRGKSKRFAVDKALCMAQKILVMGENVK